MSIFPNWEINLLLLRGPPPPPPAPVALLRVVQFSKNNIAISELGDESAATTLPPPNKKIIVQILCQRWPYFRILEEAQHSIHVVVAFQLQSCFWGNWDNPDRRRRRFCGSPLGTTTMTTTRRTLKYAEI